MKTEKKFKGLSHGHAPEEIQERLNSTSRSYLKDFVYGGIDGAVTTFAIVAGVVGADLETKTVLILGFANILADGFSMAASNYLGTKTELEERHLISQYEEKQIRENPAGEEEEVRQIFMNKGLKGEALEVVVSQVTSNRKEWLKLMLADEYGLGSSEPVPWKAGAMTFASFLIFGLIPLFPYMFGIEASFLISAIATGIAFFAIGAVKSTWTQRSHFLSGLETLAIGGAAAAIAYYVGQLFGGI